MPPRVWLITGCSSGFGQEIAKVALSRGERVIATSRKVDALESLKKLGAATLALDVCHDDDAVNEVVATARGIYGSLDVLVNNAGYILDGTIEACSAEEIEAQYSVNVFGVLRMLRAVLPFMRAQRSGVVCNMGSIGGWRGTPVGGLYCSTKFALVGITQSLKAEVVPLGIDVTIVEPGYFRTNFLTTHNRVSAAREIPELQEMTVKQRAVFDSYSRQQPGDPIKGSSIIVDMLTRSGPWAELKSLPLRVSLGRDAAKFIRDVIRDRSADHEKWASVTETTDCDDLES